MTTYQIQCHLKYKVVQPTEFIFMLQAAHHPDQNILEEKLSFNLPVAWHEFQDTQHQNRHVRLQVEPCETFELNYTATVVRHPSLSLELQQGLKEVAIPELPDEVLPYLLALGVKAAHKVQAIPAS